MSDGTNKIRAVFLHRSGLGISNRIYWESTISPTEITREQARQAQEEAGYSPLGYSFFGFSCQKVEGGFQATWNCAASCD